VQINGGAFYDVQFTNMTGAEVDYTISGAATGSGMLDVEAKPDYYLIKGLTLEGIAVDQSSSEQLMNVEFQPVGVYVKHVQTFPFAYVNENDPYIEKVLLKNSGTPMFSGIEIS